MSTGKTRPELPTNVSTQHGLDVLLTRAVAREKRRGRFRMREIHAALACHEELAADRRHCVVEIDFDTTRRQCFGRHQAGRAAADDGHTCATDFSG
jgi:hypothetical protein